LEDRTLLSVNYTNIPAALDGFLPAIQKSLNEQMNPLDLPIVGTQLQYNQNNPLPETQLITNTIQKNLDGGFQSANLNSSSVVTAVISNALPNETQITVLGDGLHTPDDPNNTQTTFKVTINVSATLSESLNFDSGLKGLHLNLISSPISVTLSYAVQLKFTATNAGDVVLDPNPNPSLVTLTITASITSIGSATLGLLPTPLNITATDGSLPSQGNPAWQTKDGKTATSSLNAPLSLTTGLQPVSYGQLGMDLDKNGGLLMSSSSMGGEGDINLGIVLTIQDFPQIASNLDVSWPLGQGQSPDVRFNDVQMDVGSFFGDIIDPVLGKIQGVTKNFQPLIDALNKPLPVLSFLGINVTLMQYFQQNMPDFATFLNIASIINSLPQVPDSPSTIMHFGSFDPGVDVSQNPLNSSTQQTPTGTNWGTIDVQLGKDDNADLQNLQMMGGIPQSGGINLQFPILDDANQVFKLLLGEPATLVATNLQFVDAYNPDDLHIPIIGPLNIVVHTEFHFSAGLTLGYDTYGLENDKPLEGFFLSGANLKIDGNVNAGPDFQVPGVELNVTGGIHGSATLGLHDPSTEGVFNNQPETPNNGPDGLVRPQEIIDDMTQAGSPLGLFDASGEIDADLSAHAEVGFNTPFGFVGVKYDKVLASVKILDFNNHGHDQPPPVLAGFNNPLDPHQLVLNMGPYAAKRGGNWTTDGDEDFTVSYVGGDPVNGETVRVSAFGFQQDFPGVTSILAEGGLGNNTVTIDPKITVDASLFGSVDPFDPNYTNQVFDPKYLNFMFDPDFANSKNVLQAGGGTSFLEGGQGTDQLVGGSGANFILGGPSQVNRPKTETLIGGTGPNIIEASTAGGTNTLIAGPLNGDILIGGDSFLNLDHFIAGQGADDMFGGAGVNDYAWQQGDGDVTVHGSGVSNVLAANLISSGGSFLIQHGQSLPLEIDMTFPGGNGSQTNIIQAENVQKVAVDDSGDGATYIIQDLSGTGVQGVMTNGHEAGAEGGQPDVVTILGSHLSQNLVDISANPTASTGAIYDQQGNLVQQTTGPVTNVDWTILGDAGPLGGGRTHYIVSTAIPKIADSLRINTGISDDTVSVESTQSGDDGVSQGGDVHVNTIAGNNTINVGAGANTVATGEGLLDRIQGNLYIDAGTGSQNQLNVDESGVTNPLNGDTLALTAKPELQNINNVLIQVDDYQLLRYKAEDLSQHPDGVGPGGGPGEKTRFPMFIQYAATGGAFGAGVNLYLTRAPDVLYITDTMPGAPTTIYTDGNLNSGNDKDKVVVGYNPLDTYGIANTTPQTSFLDNLLGPLNVVGEDWTKSGEGDADLQVFDEQPQQSSTEYVVTANEVSRSTVLTPIVISYNALGEPGFPGFLDLFSTNADNSIFVRSTAHDTSTIVNPGSAASSILVGQLLFPFPFPPLYTLDFIQGELTINGGAMDNLTINDDGNSQAYIYSIGLDANDQAHMTMTIQRTGPVGIAGIDFKQIPTVDLFEDLSILGNSTVVSGTTLGTTTNVHTGDENDSLTASTLDQIQGPVNFIWSAGIKDLTVDDTSAAGSDIYTLKNTQMPNVQELDRTGAAAITFGALHLMELFVGQLPDETFNIQAISSGTELDVFGGNGADSITDAYGNDDLSTIAGRLLVMGGANTSMYLEDQNATAGRSYSLNSDNVQGPSPQPIGFFNLTRLILDSGFMGNMTHVFGTAAGNFVTVNAGKNDQIRVGDTFHTLQGILGSLSVVGKDVNDQLTLDDSKGFLNFTYTLTPVEVDVANVHVGYTHVSNLNLDGSPGFDTYRILATIPGTQYQITASGLGNTLDGPNAPNTWIISGANSGHLNGNLRFTLMQNLLGGSGPDKFFIGISGSLTGTLDGGSGSNTLQGPNTTNNWNLTAPNAGALNASINFKNIHSLIGGAAADNFVFQTGAGITGTLNGGSGSNSLNYAPYLGNVTVNLPLGKATAIGGSISNIQNVTGSQGNDILVGDANANVLTGGAGRNIIIGGAGGDTLTGGGGDNILIDGSTVWDNNPFALQVLMNEWLLNIGFDQRVNALRKGIVVNNRVYALNTSTVLPDSGTADSMIGGPGHNWFFYDLITEIDNGAGPGLNDRVTKI
jgi:hypothetical protein